MIEDEEVNAQVLTALLVQAGHTVSLARDGAEALALAGHDDFDAVLVDLRLPGMDGFQVTRRLHALLAERGAYVPVIAVTANLMPEDHSACAAAGMVAVVPKPIDPPRLHAALAITQDPSRAMPMATPSTGILDIRLLEQLAEDLGADHLRSLTLNALDVMAERLRLLSEEQDLAQIADLAHKLAGAAGSHGLAAARLQAKDLEYNARNGDGPACRAVLAQLQADFAQGRTALLRWLEDAGMGGQNQQ